MAFTVNPNADAAEDIAFQDGWRKGRERGFEDGVREAQTHYVQIAEEEAQYVGDEDGEIWIARRIADRIRASVPAELEARSLNVPSSQDDTQ